MNERVGFGKRLGALCLDVVLTMILGVLGGSLLGGVLGGAAGAGAAAGAGGGSGDLMGGGAAAGGIFGMVLGAIAGIAVAGVLYGLIEAFTGASPGKMLLGIRIRAANGTEPGMGALLTRYAIKNVAALCSMLVLLTSVQIFDTVGNYAGLVVGLGCFMVLGSAKQGLHDLLAGTAVYSSR